MVQPVSMPWSTPVFPPPPHAWNGVRTAVFPFAIDVDAVRAVLPPALEAAEGVGMVALLSYPWGANIRIHPFNEAVVLVPARCNGQLGTYVPFIYVTTDEALIAGREAAGWPKKLAEITWERDGDRVRVAVVRWGRTLLAFDGEVNVDLPADADLAGLAGLAGEPVPTFNYKLVPGPGDEIEVEEVIATTLEIVPSAIEVGMGTLVAASSEDDPVASVVPSAGGPFAALVSDNTIPCGTVVHRVDGRVRR